MKRKLFLSLAALLAFSLSYSQLSKTEYELLKDNFKLEKKAVVAEALKLNTKEENAFWPIYNQYETERAAIGTKSWNLLEEYANKYSSLADTSAVKLVRSSLGNMKSYITLREKYLKIIAQKVSPGVAARFIQIEDYLYTYVRSQALSEIPLISDIKPK